jgi:hypothetical protein
MPLAKVVAVARIVDDEREEIAGNRAAAREVGVRARSPVPCGPDSWLSGVRTE